MSKKQKKDHRKSSLSRRQGNQAFEYWFLLHYNLYTGPIHRSQYKDMLTKPTGMSITRARDMEH